MDAVGRLLETRFNAGKRQSMRVVGGEGVRFELDDGRRDAAHDQELPVPFARRVGVRTEPVATSDLEVFALNDQHARARIRRDLQLEPGDLLGFHVSHPCTTFDNWGLVPLVNDDYRVLEAIRSYL